MNGIIRFRGTLKDGSTVQLQQMQDGSWVLRIENGNKFKLLGWRKEQGHAKGIEFNFRVPTSQNVISIN